MRHELYEQRHETHEKIIGATDERRCTQMKTTNDTNGHEWNAALCWHLVSRKGRRGAAAQRVAHRLHRLLPVKIST